MRLFVAVDLDDAARAAVAAEQQRLRAALTIGSPIRWVRPEQLHMTLVFLGEIDSARADALVDAIGRPIARPPFDLVFEGIGAFPRRGAPRALWVGLSAGDAELRGLQQVLADRAAVSGVPLEERPFSPHLTLGRWKASRPSDRPLALGAGRGGVVARTRIAHATLYQSRVSSAGSVYTELARATLSDR